MKRAALCLALLGLLLCACGQGEAPAAEPSAPLPVSAAPLPELPEHPDLPQVRLYFDGLLRGRGYLYQDQLYLPPALICDYYALAYRDESGGDSLRLELPGVSLRGESGLGYLEAEGRYLYCPDGWLWDGNTLCLPAPVIEHLFGLTVTESEARDRADIGSTGYVLLSGGENYYSRKYNPEDLYWLSHIIYSEAHLEPFEGQVAVGNVVLNRVADQRFPSTIVTVALDQRQFDPVSSRQVLYPTDETAMIAACLCLEGYSAADGVLYFVNPAIGEDDWFQRELEPVCVIGNHHFYK